MRLHFQYLVYIILLGCACNLGMGVPQHALPPDPLPSPPEARYAFGTGPLVLVENAGFPQHSIEEGGTYSSMRAVWEADGYRVESAVARPAELGDLAGVDEYVLLRTNNPVTTAQVAIFGEWITQGGSLFLILDHPPFSNAVTELAAALGVWIINNDTMIQYGCGGGGCTTFVKETHPLHIADANSSDLLDLPGIADGVEYFSTFRGTSMVGGAPFLVFGPNTRDSSGSSLAGLSQGVIVEHGAGRVVVLGEAAACAHQNPFGEYGFESLPFLNYGVGELYAEYNARLCLNVVRWLDPLN